MGGTFTDVVLVDESGRPRIDKIPSSRSELTTPISALLEHKLPRWGIPAESLARFVHGTTVATNAVLERRGARIGLITTHGFRDILEIGSVKRLSQVYKDVLDPVTPGFLCPRRLRKGVRERTEADGSVSLPLDEGDFNRAVDELVAAGVEAVAICFLFSFLNPENERRAEALLRQRHPEMPVSVSYDVDGRVREYERLCVTGFDAYTKPLLDRYIKRMEDQLSGAHVAGPLQLMQSRGGIAGAHNARRQPVRLFLSGPAAGVVGARAVGREAGFDHIISLDVGGTSSDIALITDGQPILRQDGYVDGYQIRVPMVDVNAVGAGGGSIAWVDSGGGLRVGPRSAGAEPGPACYGKGGTDATVTDASLVLNWLDPSFFAGGSVRLDAARAHRAIEERIAMPLGISVEDAALAVHRVVNAQMAEGIRLVSVRRGIDPRSFVLVGFGGGGPIHATALARDLGINTVVIPAFPGVLSAIGLLSAPVEHSASAPYGATFAQACEGDIVRICFELRARCAAEMAREAIDPSSGKVRYHADVCYVGQSYHLEVEIDPKLDGKIVERAFEAFFARHLEVRGHAMRKPARFVNLRAVHTVPQTGKPISPSWQPELAPLKARRTARFDGKPDRLEAQVLDRAGMRPGYRFEGPAIVEQPDTTTVVEPGWIGEVHSSGALILTRKETGVPGPQVFDPVALEVIRHRLDGIANEMQVTLMQASFSNIVKEGEDCSSAIFTTGGEPISLALAHPIHLSTMIPALGAILDDFPPETMVEGDLYMMNDPYRGGTHLPDILIARPAFADGRLVAISVSLTHHQDVGGMTPGSIPPNAIDVFQEGLRIPPLQFCKAGVFDDAVMRLLRGNSRTPDEFMGDVDAQVSACAIGARRVREAAEAYGPNVLLEAFRLLLDRSEEMTRAALRQLPEGTYRAVEFLDNDGVEIDRKVRIEVAVTVCDGNFHIDFTGSASQTRGPVNSTPSSTMAAAYWCIRAITGDGIPTNGGCFRPVSVVLPPATVVNPELPAPVNARAGTVKLLCSAIMSAFGEALPGRIAARSAHIATFLALGGKWPDGTPFVANQAMMGGTGGSPGRDGVEFIETDVTNGRHGGVEVFELATPARIRRYEVRPDGAGAGQFRGGTGAVREIEFLVDDIRLSYRGERHFSQAAGLKGGAPGAPSTAMIHRVDGSREELRSKGVVTVSAGDVLVLESAGGGGWGDPSLRDSAAIAEDVANGKVSCAAERQAQ